MKREAVAWIVDMEAAKRGLIAALRVLNRRAARRGLPVAVHDLHGHSTFPRENERTRAVCAVKRPT